MANDIDIKGSITRDELEAASAKLVLRINKVVETAMNQAGLSAGDLHFVELFGGGTRVPRIQQSLQELLGRETLDKHLNSDEAAAVGAAFIAATQSSQMKGKEFKLKNATQSGVEVIYSIPNTGKTDKLYNTTSRFGTKRVIKLNTTEEFDVILAYQGLSDLPLEGTSHNLGTFRFSNLPTAETVVNMTGEPLVKVRIHLTDSGLVEMLGAEANVTYMGQREVKVPRPLPDDYVEEFEEVETDAPTIRKLSLDLVPRLLVKYPIVAHRGADCLDHPKNGNLIQCPRYLWARASRHPYLEIFEYVVSRLHHVFVYSDGERFARWVAN